MSWTAPQYTPDYFNVSVGCFRLCDNTPTQSGVQIVPDGGGATNHTITALDPGNACTVNVIAVFGNTSSESDQVVTTTLTDGMHSATVALFIFTSCLSLSLSLSLSSPC